MLSKNRSNKKLSTDASNDYNCVSHGEHPLRLSTPSFKSRPEKYVLYRRMLASRRLSRGVRLAGGRHSFLDFRALRNGNSVRELQRGKSSEVGPQPLNARQHTAAPPQPAQPQQPAQKSGWRALPD